MTGTAGQPLPLQSTADRRRYLPFPDLMTGGLLPQIVLVGLWTAAYLPYLNWQGQLVLVGLLFLCASAYRLSRLIRWYPKGLILNDRGIEYGRHFIPWGEIKKASSPLSRQQFLMLVLADGRHIYIRLFSVVLTVLVPEILARNADVEVTPRLEKVMAKRRRGLPSWAQRVWLTGLAVVAGVTLLDAWIAREMNACWLVVPFATGFFLMLFRAFSLGTADRRVDYWALECGNAAVVPLLPLLAHFLSDIPLRSLDAGLAASAALLLVAAYVQWRDVRLVLRNEVAMSAVLVLAGAIAAILSPRALIHRDLSSFVPRGNYAPLVWSPNGEQAAACQLPSRFATPVRGGGALPAALIHFGNSSSMPLPASQPSPISISFTSAGILRLQQASGSATGNDHLMLYDPRTGKEVELAQAPRIGIASMGAFSPDGRKLCWLEFVKGYYEAPPGYWTSAPPTASQNHETTSEPTTTSSPAATAPYPTNPPHLKVRDLATGQVQTVSGPWEAMADVRWVHCGWAADGEVVVAGLKAPLDGYYKLGFLNAYRLRVADGQYTCFTSRQTFYRMHFAPDSLSAFGDAHFSFIDIANRTEVGLGGIPRWHPSGKMAFRIESQPSGDRFLRFDPKRAKETVLAEFGPGVRIRDWSPSGRYLIIDMGFRINPLRLVDLTTRRQIRLETSMVTSFMAGRYSIGSNWSPDERMILMTTVKDFLKPVVPMLAFDIPEEW